MILACDIGNTNIAIGVFRDGALVLKSSFPTNGLKQFPGVLQSSLKKKGFGFIEIKAAVICSVVPGLNKAVEAAIKSLGNIPLYWLGKNLKVPIKNLYAKPKQVGQDRLLCAYMAMKLYGAPVISIDLGTALTFDVVSQNKAYRGGIILPGLALALSALHQNTALLPEVKVRRGRSLIGNDTKESMLSGITFGYGSLIDGLADKLKEKIGKNAKVVLTGGGSLFIKPYCRTVDYVEPDLIVRAMAQVLREKKIIAKIIANCNRKCER